MKRLIVLFGLCLSLSLVVLGLGCDQSGDGNGGESCPTPNLYITVCYPSAGPFSLVIDNDFFPLVVGKQLVLQGVDDEGVTIRLEITVLNETEVVAGVTTRVMEEREYEDGELIEVSRNFFAQAPDGTVCYFGEDVDIYEEGQVVSHEGEWRAGEDFNLPGIYMPGSPEVGMTFHQEFAPGLAEDIATIEAFGEEIDVPAGIFNDTLTAEDCNPLEGGGRDTKVYVRGIGLAIDEDAELVTF